MPKSIRNTTGAAVSIDDTGITVPASSTYTIVPVDFPLWAASSSIDTLIDAGTLVVNDGLDDLKPDMGKRHIHNESAPRDISYHAAAQVQATANSTLTLTVASRLLNIFTGTVSGQIVKLPSATLLNNGFRFEFWNVSTQTVTINNNGSIGLFSIASQQKTSATLQDNSTSNGIWLFEANFLGGTGGGNGCLNFGYNGTANANRWLEVIGNNPSNGTPFIIAGSKAIRAFSVGTDINSTATVTLFKNGVAIDSISLAAVKKNTKLNLNIILIDKDELSAQVTSGTISRPIFTLWL